MIKIETLDNGYVLTWPRYKVTKQPSSGNPVMEMEVIGEHREFVATIGQLCMKVGELAGNQAARDL